MLQQYNPKNAEIQVWVNGLCPRQQARVSVFDSVVQGGDAVWEGLRVYKGGIFCLSQHLERLQHSAKALAFAEVPPLEEIKQAIFATLQANGMRDETHIRLTLTRGEKVTSGMDPRLNTRGTTLIVLAEWKPLVYDNERGIRVITSGIQRNSPRYLDSKIHHNNLLNNILAKIQANVAGADAGLMLDDRGFVAELNDTNLFMVQKGQLYTPHADACLHGITRGLVIALGRELGLEVVERNLSLTEFYNADEVFCCGTMGELTPVVEIDGRKIENRSGSRIKDQLHRAFLEKIPALSEPLPF
ncbi:aminotransferase class IV [Cesiribacter andamanensis]|uniref:branched-chain-amino-acid transaminase n=1 Tax=Cesiribacter andamanensis AMV16 TaxID=1279009 RepID=M7NY50_9BACT|nr:aminotransferase class IV [Cesiribacter andamanensis]EMR03279.1 Branched-chain-amino-acid aminotransferase [Cesiribacter andamanensis AMV16]